MKYKGIIFDLDGVICSTDEYHYQAWKQLANRIGVPFDRTVNNRLRGVSRMASLDIILEQSDKRFTDAEKQDMAEEKNRTYRKLLNNMTPADLSDKVRDTLEWLSAQGLRMAIGSSSKNAPFILDRIGLAGWFDAVCDGNQISHSKPDSEVFIKAADMLGLAPRDCLVVEDALAGAEAGHRGGFDVACLGDAALAGAGEYNLRSFCNLTSVIAEEQVW